MGGYGNLTSLHGSRTEYFLDNKGGGLAEYWCCGECGVGVFVTYCDVEIFGDAEDTDVMDPFDVDLFIFVADCVRLAKVGNFEGWEGRVGDTDCEYVSRYGIMWSRLDESSGN